MAATATLIIRDQSTTGSITNEIALEFLTERITVRELIRSRVYQEVKDYNARQPEEFRGLVQPTDAERTLNGYKLREKRMIDWQPQFDNAIEAFEHNRILVLINDHQAADLDEEVVIEPGTTVSFVKLVPLVGG